ncbi:Uncharacterised protein [uncultured archaeon]|nr:Uncharacterised protein [uncultured archaeon]
MLTEILKEKTSADHLLYVSMKYTKTCDVILNLIARWKSMMEISFDAMLDRAKEEKIIPALPTNPKQKIEYMRQYFKKQKATQEALALYIFFKRVPELQKTREGEFRKNVCLKVIEPGKTTEINLEKLKEYSEILERFISEVKLFLHS